MICEECKTCWNYQVSEVGCYGNSSPCHCFVTDDQGQYDDGEYDEWDEYDPCEDCRINGDDYFENEDGELESYCEQCSMNPDRFDEWDY